MDKQLPWRQWLPEFVLLAAMWGSSFLFMREGGDTQGELLKEKIEKIGLSKSLALKRKK